MDKPMKLIELCAGAGGQAIGLHNAGFESIAMVEWNPKACQTLRHNHPEWPVIEGDLKQFDTTPYQGDDITLIAGGVPCQPFSIAGQQLGNYDERDLFPEAIRIVSELQPQAFMFENVAGLASSKFDSYRERIISDFEDLGYVVEYCIVNAMHFGVPQDRKRFLIVGKKGRKTPFPWPEPNPKMLTVGEVLYDLMAEADWPGAKNWAEQANKVAPTIVGGSEKHGGPDLGPTRARKMWAEMNVDGLGIANAPPDKDFPVDGMPKLTTQMVALLQGFPHDWVFPHKKTATYRQIGNAFPPPVAEAMGLAIIEWLKADSLLKPENIPVPFYKKPVQLKLNFG